MPEEQIVSRPKKSVWKRIYDKYFSKELPIRTRFFNIIFACGFLWGISGGTACIMLGSTKMAIMIGYSMAVLFPGMMIIANVSSNFQLLVNISMQLVNFVVMPAIYLSGGGIDCGIPSYFVLGLMLNLFLVDGKTGIVTSALETVWYAFIYWISFYKHFIVLEIPGAKFTYNAIWSNALMVAVLMGILIREIFRLYQKENLLVNQTIKKLDELATIDPLTTTFNRRYMYDYLGKKIDSARNDGIPLSVAMFDIDHFKNLNDDFGHIVGDNVLIRISAVIKSYCQNQDIVARYGGEEFLLIMPETNFEEAKERAENIRCAIESTKFDEEINRPVTISGGVAEFSKSMTAETFVDTADKALYKAKGTGRNKICAG